MRVKNIVLAANSLFQKSQKTGLGYVLRLDPDRLLSPVCSALGKTPKALAYGGWEKMQIKGHSLGHYMSALSAFFDSTGCCEAKQKLDYVVFCLKKIQRADGYIAGIPSTPFDAAFSGEFSVERFSLAGWWVPWYSIHKIYAGLIDAYEYGKNEDALEIAKKMADWAVLGAAKMNYEQFQKMLFCEHGGMTKVFADLYALTKNENYLQMAKRFVHDEIFLPLKNHEDKLQGMHANTQIPKILGLARLYEVTKNEEYRNASEFFFETVAKNRSYAIAGNSKGEHFSAPFTEPLERDTCETCNSYNMLELSEHIFLWNKNSFVAEFYERALYNHILASQKPKTGEKTYFVSMKPGFFKIYGSFENAFWCCTGTGMENPARYNRFIAFDIDGEIFINLFIPCVFQTNDGWKFKIKTNFPYEEKAEICVLKKGSFSRAIKVRAPKWTLPKKNADKNGYVLLCKNACKGDVFNVELPMKFHTRMSHDKSGNFSIFYGPLVLAAEIHGSVPNQIVDNQLLYMNAPTVPATPITADPFNPETWIQKKEFSELVFETAPFATKNNEPYMLRPFYDIHKTRYTCYFNSQDQKEEERKEKFLEATIDKIEVGAQQSEIEHNFHSFQSKAGYLQEVDASFRKIFKGGFISYDMKIESGAQFSRVYVAVFGEDFGETEIFLNEKKAGKINIKGGFGKCLFDFDFAIPNDLLKNEKINIKIFCLSDEMRIFELRTTNKNASA